MSMENYEKFVSHMERRFRFEAEKQAQKTEKTPLEGIKTACSKEEFEQLKKEGKPFQVKEKTGVHIICFDPTVQPIIQVKGRPTEIAAMLAFLVSEMVEDLVKRGGTSREAAERMFRMAIEIGIEKSR